MPKPDRIMPGIAKNSIGIGLNESEQRQLNNLSSQSNQEQQRPVQEAEQRASEIKRAGLEQQQLAQREFEADRVAKQEAEERHERATAELAAAEIGAAAASNQSSSFEGEVDDSLEAALALTESHETAQQRDEKQEAIRQVAKFERSENLQRQLAIQDVEIPGLNDARKIVQKTYVEASNCFTISTSAHIVALSKLMLAGEITMDSANKYLITSDLGPDKVEEMCNELSKPLMTQINPVSLIRMIPKPIENILDIIENHSITIANEVKKASSKMAGELKIAAADSALKEANPHEWELQQILKAIGLDNSLNDSDRVIIDIMRGQYFKPSALLGEEASGNSHAAASQSHPSDFHE